MTQMTTTKIIITDTADGGVTTLVEYQGGFDPDDTTPSQAFAIEMMENLRPATEAGWAVPITFSKAQVARNTGATDLVTREQMTTTTITIADSEDGGVTTLVEYEGDYDPDDETPSQAFAIEMLEYMRESDDRDWGVLTAFSKEEVEEKTQGR